MTKTVYIGSGAGFAGDRRDAGIAVVETLRRRNGPRYLIFEVMGERATPKPKPDPKCPECGETEWVCGGVAAECAYCGEDRPE